MHSDLTRRHLLSGLGGLALAGCHRGGPETAEEPARDQPRKDRKAGAEKPA